MILGRIGEAPHVTIAVVRHRWDQLHQVLRYGIEKPLGALVTLVMSFNEGIILERLSGVETGQAALLDWIDGWITRKDAR